MRKLLEKPIFHYSLVLAMVSLVCGLAIGGVNAITAPVIEQNIIDATNAAYQEVMPGIVDAVEITNSGNPTSIDSIIDAQDASGQTLGYIYVASGTNKFGSIQMIVGIDNNGMITGAGFITLKQTYKLTETRTNLSYYVGSSITNLMPSGDLISGATYSLTLVQSLLADIATTYQNTQTGVFNTVEFPFLEQSEVTIR